MGTEKLQFYSSNGNVAVVSCFSSHLAFQWVALSFNKVLSIQIHPCLCWKGDRKHGFFLDVLFDPCTEWLNGLWMKAASIPLRPFLNHWAEPLDQNYPHLLSVFSCDLQFLHWLPEGTIPTVWELHKLQLRKNLGCNYLFPAPPSWPDLEAVIMCS